jgi:hypothetical protein
VGASKEKAKKAILWLRDKLLGLKRFCRWMAELAGNFGYFHRWGMGNKSIGMSQKYPVFRYLHGLNYGERMLVTWFQIVKT